MSAKERREIRYDDVRKRIKNGDVLLYKGRGLVSWLVQRFTRSSYSHAGLATWWNERLMVMEAVGKGVVVTPLSVNIESYKGDVDWYWCRTTICDPCRKAMIQFAQQELGKSFAHWRMLLVGIYIFFKKRFDRNDKFCKANKLFCSFYVAETYNSIGLDLACGKSDSFTTPDDISRSPLLVKKGVLKKERN